jgi:hypothetical protein
MLGNAARIPIRPEPEYTIVLAAGGVNSAEDALRLKLRELLRAL